MDFVHKITLVIRLLASLKPILQKKKKSKPEAHNRIVAHIFFNAWKKPYHQAQSSRGNWLLNNASRRSQNQNQHFNRRTDEFFPEWAGENGVAGSHWGAGAIPVLLLAVEKSAVMGQSLWERKGTIKGDGTRLAFLEAGAVHLSLFCVFSLMASAPLLLAPCCLWSVP